MGVSASKSSPHSWLDGARASSSSDGAPLRVVHLAAPAPIGGLETALVGLCRGLLESGTHITVAAVVHRRPEDHPVVRRLREEGVPVHPIVVPVRGYLRERREVRALLERTRPDVVHTHGYRTGVVDSGIAARAGIPTVATVHGLCRTTLRSTIYERLELRALRRFDAVVAVSRRLAEELDGEGVAPERLHLVPNAWAGRGPKLGRAEARAELGIPADARVVGWIGRLVPVKGCDVFLDALRWIDPTIRAEVVGTGPELDSLRNRALGSEGPRVTFHGERSCAADLLPAFDALVLSSRSEGTPMVLFEAMAARVPIVATRVGGVPDVLSEREALLVPPEDPHALADAVGAVFGDRAAAARRVESAQAALDERFTLEAWTWRHLRIYRTLATRPTGSDRR